MSTRRSAFAAAILLGGLALVLAGLLASPDLCIQCHEAQAALDDIELACVFDTGAGAALARAIR